MIKLLRNLIKFFQAIILLAIPFLILYFFLLQIKFEELTPLKEMLGFVFDGFIEFTRIFIDATLKYHKENIDFTPLVTAAGFWVIYFVLELSNKSIDLAEKTIKKNKKQELIKKQKEEEIEMKEKLKEDFLKYKVAYLILELNLKQNEKLSYLQDDVGTKNDVIIKDILNSIIKFGGKLINSNPENNFYEIIFYNIDKAGEFAIFVRNLSNQYNSQKSSILGKLSFKASCHCALGENVLKSDRDFSYRILKLAGESEILAGELFKNKYEFFNKNNKIHFLTKGIYDFDLNKNVEVFLLR
ncbi:MAG: hypothetical protein PHV68_01245 [Candidatus Gastranaerophilales bacterium]|nr:hypothetical protein [Candidatus Gastranaerophilales bacterium]